MESTKRKHFNSTIITYTLGLQDACNVATYFLNRFCKDIKYAGLFAKTERCISLVYDVTCRWGDDYKHYQRKTFLIDVPIVHDFEITKDSKLKIDNEFCFLHVQSMLWDSYNRLFMDEMV